MDKLKKYIKDRDFKDLAIIGVFMVGVVYLVALNYGGDENSDKVVAQKQEDASSFTPVSEYSDLKLYFTKKISNKLNESSKKVERIEGEVNKSNELRKKKIDEVTKMNSELAKQIELLRKDMEKYKKQHSSDTGLKKVNSSLEYDPNIIPASSGTSLSANSYGGYSAGSQQQDVIGFSDEIEVVTVELKNNNKQTFKNIKTYLPAGTHIRGIIVGGVEAHTEVAGSNKTRVVTIRLVEGGDAPNGFVGDMQNCVLLASAWGNASSERVAMRGERLSCVGNTGRVLETDVIATVYGPDGRQDVRGRVVYPEAKLLSRAFLAGTLSGVGNGLANSMANQSISPLGATSIIPNEDIFKYGAAQGVGKGLDKLADYYIKRAEQLQPVIQVGSGVEVDVVIQKGFYLDGRKDNEKPGIKGDSFVDNDNQYDASKAASLALSNFGGIVK
jgi:conjugal transfer pilus assembly protein TraB